MTEHSNIIGGSSATKRINCPGSYELEEQMPEGETSEYAERGSMLHAAMELLITADPSNIKDAQPLLDDLVGQDLGFEGHTITDELIVDKLGPALRAWWEFCEVNRIDDWFIETRVSLEKVIPGAFGTADIIAKSTDGKLHVLDWKFGDGVVVNVEGNYGAGFYAAAALYDDDEEIKDFCSDILDDVGLHIVQPKTGETDSCLHSWNTTITWLESLIDLAVTAVETAQQPNPPTKTGDWCKFCRGKPICPEYQQLSGEAMSKEPKSMSSVELAEYLRKAELLKGWINDIFSLAQAELEGGAAIPGYKLVQKRATRKYIDPTEVEAILKRSKIKVDDMYDKKLMSPAQIEKRHKRIYEKKIAPLVHSVSSGVTIAVESDKRPAVTGSMALLANAMPEIQET